jgi:hypothetical protein
MRRLGGVEIGIIVYMLGFISGALVVILVVSISQVCG